MILEMSGNVTSLPPELKVIGVLGEGILSLLFVLAAWPDLRFRRIPNRLLLAAFVLRLLLWAAKMRVVLGGAYGSILQELGGGLLLAALLLLVGKICKNGLGMGDVKFLFTAALFAGFWRTVSILFLGLLPAAAWSLVCLGTGRFSRTNRYPLGPFFLAGYILERLI